MVPSGDQTGLDSTPGPLGQLAQVRAVRPDREDVAVRVVGKDGFAADAGSETSRRVRCRGPVDVSSREPTIATPAARARTSRAMSRSQATRSGGATAGRVMTAMGSHLSRLAQARRCRVRRVRSSTLPRMREVGARVRLVEPRVEHPVEVVPLVHA